MADDKFNRYCEQLLLQYKRRNTKAVTRHLKSVCDSLRHEDDHVVQTKFGGSVQKGTYVTGLSDVDVLLIVNQSSLKNKPPSKVIAFVRDTIQQRLPKNPVTAGKLAVTVSYADKTEIQILPAIRTTDGFRIAHPGSTKWSNVVHPDRFAERLIKVNNARGEESYPQLSSPRPWRTASSKIPAGRFRDTTWNRWQSLVHFLGHSVKAVITPTKDPTGQTRYVDGYLGQADSGPRKRASTCFGQMRDKVISCRNRAEFDDLFCEEH